MIAVRRKVWVNGMSFGVKLEFFRDDDNKFVLDWYDVEWGEGIDGWRLCDKEECSELEGWAESYHKEIEYFLYSEMGCIVEEALGLEGQTV